MFSANFQLVASILTTTIYSEIYGQGTNMLAKTHPPKIRVLIIDDSRLIRIAASRMFGDSFDVLLAVDGSDGWDIIQKDKDIQIVFTDLVMPEMDGFELLEKIRTCKDEAINSIPVIVATGADNTEVAKQKAFALGATDFITKPFDATDIKTRARSYAQFRQANMVLKEQTTIDSMTGLLNAKGFHRQLDKEMAFINRHKSSITVMSVEIDSFKDLFIRIGRAGAEAIIKKVGDVLAETVRREDTVARTSVAGFAISMPLARGENALELANRMCQTVESFRAKLDGKKITITVSIGVCAVEPSSTGDVDIVLDVADTALTRAASLGRSQLYQMTLQDYHREQALLRRKTLSIDSLLERIKSGEQNNVVPYLDTALERLAPLLVLLSNEQKQRVITYR